MHRTIVAVGVLASGLAAAKPLPKGIKVTAKLGRPLVQQGQTTVPLRDDDLADYETIGKAELADDGKTIVVTAMRCKGTLTDDQTKVPLAKVQARIDATLGLAAFAKKRYAEAITRLTSATQKDPDSPAYATGLLAAQVAGKKLDAAAQTLAVHGRRNPAWFAWRLAIDPELAAIKDHKRAKELAAPKPGTATFAKLGDKDVALSDAGGGMAALRTSSSGVALPAAATGTTGPSGPAGQASTTTGPSGPAGPASTTTGTTVDLDIVSLQTGRVLARLPIIALEDGCDDTEQAPCGDAAAASIAARRTLADQLLAQLGFEVTANAFLDARNGDPITKGGVTLEFADDAITASRGGNERSLAIDASAWAVAFTPKAAIVKLNKRHLLACDDTSSRFVGAAIALP